MAANPYFCRKCETRKQPKDFYKESKIRCKECINAKCREYSSKSINKKRRKFTFSYSRASRVIKRVAIHKELMKIKKECEICGEKDYRCLEFDHVRGTKKQHVSLMISQLLSIKVIRKEAAKCRVLCSNCHHKKNWDNSAIPEVLALFKETYHT